MTLVDLIEMRPYLVRAIHEWIVDTGGVPHIVVDVDEAGTGIPPEAQPREDGTVIFNISYSAADKLTLTNEAITFNGRFRGTARPVYIPIGAVLGIVSRESGRGIFFPRRSSDDEDEASNTSDAQQKEIEGAETGQAQAESGAPPPRPTGPPSLKIVK